MNRPSGYTAIPIVNGDDLKPEDIEAFERVLKFCAEAKGLTFTPDQAIMVMRQTSNTLRWQMDMHIKDLEYKSYDGDRRFVAIDKLRDRIVIVECNGEPDTHHLEYLRDVNQGDENRLPVVDSWGMTEGERAAQRGSRRSSRY
jgi:hypothetical protein